MNWRSQPLQGGHESRVVAVEMSMVEKTIVFKIMVGDAFRFFRRCESLYDLQLVVDQLKRLIVCPVDRQAALAFIDSHRHRF